MSSIEVRNYMLRAKNVEYLLIHFPNSKFCNNYHVLMLTIVSAIHNIHMYVCDILCHSIQISDHPVSSHFQSTMMFVIVFYLCVG